MTRTTLDAQIVVLAKAPEPGRVKTRLTPPYTPEQSAALARAALQDTLDAAAASGVRRCVLACDGDPGDRLPAAVDLIGQRGAGLDERIAHALYDCWTAVPLPMLLIGMDTPQVTPGLLRSAVLRLLAPGTDAVLGGAADGGFWALGLRRPRPDLVLGVPMSTGRTGADVRARLDAARQRVRGLPVLRDVDGAADAEAVARLAPGSRFAGLLRSLRDAEGAA